MTALASPAAVTLYRALADGLSDMVEGGRLNESAIPDDYAWLADQLEKVAGADPEGVAAPQVFIVTGESDSVSGVIVSTHATEAGATAKAVSLVNTLLDELELDADATPENWRERVETLEDETGGGSYVSLESFPLEACNPCPAP